MQASKHPMFPNIGLASALARNDVGSRKSVESDVNLSSAESPEFTTFGTLASSVHSNWFRSVPKAVAPTDQQRVDIARIVNQHKPLIVELRKELREKQHCLAALHPASDNYLYKAGRLSNDIGTLATQLALTSNKLKTDVYNVFTPDQQYVVGSLPISFELFT